MDERFLEQVSIDVDEADIERGRGLLGAVGVDSERVIAIHPGSGGEEKCWPLDNFIELAGRFEAEGFNVVFLLGPVERDRWGSERIDFLKKICR